MASSKPHCNCRVKESCPFNGVCLQSSVVYGCKTTSNDTTQDPLHYTDLDENIFKGIIMLNLQATYKTKRKINQRHYLTGT